MHAKEYNPDTQPPARIPSQGSRLHWIYVAALGSVLVAWSALALMLVTVFRLNSANVSFALFDLEVSLSPFVYPSAEFSGTHYFWIEVSLPGLLLVVLASLLLTYFITWAIVARRQS